MSSEVPEVLMFENLPFITVPGKDRSRDLKLLSLSTCAFCKRAMDFLTKNGQEFSYLQLDEIEPDKKAQLKLAFFNKFSKQLSYPTLVVNQETILIGFIQKIWEEGLNLPQLL